MIQLRPLLGYVAYKSEVLKTLGPNVKPRSITLNKLDTSDVESPQKEKEKGIQNWIKKSMPPEKKIASYWSD